MSTLGCLLCSLWAVGIVDFGSSAILVLFITTWNLNLLYPHLCHESLVWLGRSEIVTAAFVTIGMDVVLVIGNVLEVQFTSGLGKKFWTRTLNLPLSLMVPNANVTLRSIQVHVLLVQFVFGSRLNFERDNNNQIPIVVVRITRMRSLTCSSKSSSQSHSLLSQPQVPNDVSPYSVPWQTVDSQRCQLRFCHNLYHCWDQRLRMPSLKQLRSPEPVSGPMQSLWE